MLYCLRYLFISVLLTWSFVASGTEAAFAAEEKTVERSCQNCHAKETELWQGSHHSKAMAFPTDSNVLGDFSDVRFSHYSKSARFYREKSYFKIDFREDDQLTRYQVAYTFGVYPLQQYLVEVESGRYQVFPFAWDSRNAESGGQRWYATYDENIPSDDRLHWQQPLQNWNGMCADCHSNGFKRKFLPRDNSFNSTWEHINVSCESCHGSLAEDHGRQPKQKANFSKPLSETNVKNIGFWTRSENEPVAHWQGEKRDNRFMETCFACHSLRSPLTDGFSANTPFLDSFIPTLINNIMYYPDGQIKEEVYVYGSFLQSKMYQAGVNCLDCHNSHSMALKAEGNELCLQCHNPQEYQQIEHTRHDLDSIAGQCVSCHMPETKYMGVDARRDHSFVIPRPHISESKHTPNACIQCHDDKSDAWALNTLKSWHGDPKPITQDEALFLRLLNVGYLSREEHLQLANSLELSVIKRASAINLLPSSVGRLSGKQFLPWVQSVEPLVRLAAAQAGNLLPEPERKTVLSILLKDKYKAVRVAAANHLVGMKHSDFHSLQNAVEELFTANNVNSWRGEGNFNQSLIYSKQGKLKASIESLKRSISIDPYFDAAYVNLAETYRTIGNAKLERDTLKQGLTTNPNSGPINYSFGLLEIRSGKNARAVGYFFKAKQSSSNNAQYAYLYFLSLDNAGKTKQALDEIMQSIDQYQSNPQLVELALSFAHKLGDRDSFNEIKALLTQRY